MTVPSALTVTAFNVRGFKGKRAPVATLARTAQVIALTETWIQKQKQHRNSWVDVQVCTEQPHNRC